MAPIPSGNPTPRNPAATPSQPHRPHRRRGQRLLRILGAVVVLGLLVVFLIPPVLSMGWARRRIVAAMDEALDSPVSLEEHSFGWFSGLEIRKLRIGNPRSYPEQGDLLRLEQGSFDISFLFYLLGGDLALRAKADGVEVRLHQLQDGRTNLGAVGGPDVTWHFDARSRGEHRAPDPDKDAGVLTHLEVDLALTNALIEVTHERLGVLESVRNLNASIRKQEGAIDIACRLDAELYQPGASTPPGRLSARADMDVLRSRPFTFHVETTGLDLARYRPLLDWASANPFEELQGVLSGKADATRQPDGTTTIAGHLVLAQPRLKTLGERGTTLGGGPLRIDARATFEESRPLPLHLTLAWQGGRVGGGAVRLLRYAVPLLASSPGFEADLETTMKLEGPLPDHDREPTLQWLGRWRGTGRLQLRDGHFTPARPLAQLLTPAGEPDRIAFQSIDTEFVIREGTVETRLLEMKGGTQACACRGQVFLDGRIDCRIRRQLDDTVLEARLEGTLDDPELSIDRSKGR